MCGRPVAPVREDGPMSTDLQPRPTDRDSGLLLVAAMAALMWLVEIVDLAAGDLDRFGIEPRELDGLDGIVFSPFLHAGFGHLLGNTIPFVILGAVIALGGLARVAVVTAIVALAGGLGTWLVGPDGSIHVGASGVVFGYATYLLVRGFYSRRMLHVAAGVGVLLVFGTTLLVGLVPTPGVSWQGHLFGGLAGVLAARVVHGRTRRALA